jgi:hypothetical protein
VPSASPPDPSDAASLNAAGPGSQRRDRDFAQLARRITSRTTDLLALALVTVVLLTLGVQVTRWWRTDSSSVGLAPASGAPLSVWDDPAALSLEITAGEWSLRRQSVAGVESAVTDTAIAAVRPMLDAASVEGFPPVDAAERQWLDRLRDWSPQARFGDGDVFVLGGPWPWVVATTLPGGQPAGTDQLQSRRVVGWAFALPQSHGRWTLYVAQRSADVAPAAVDSGDVPLPVDARPLLAVRSASGGFMAFRGLSDWRQLQADWDLRLTAAGWSRAGDWLADRGQARATFHVSGATPRQLEALLAETPDGSTTGIADWSTRSESPRSP